MINNLTGHISTHSCEVNNKEAYTGPLMMRAIITFISAIYSCRSGYGRSSSVPLLATSELKRESLCRQLKGVSLKASDHLEHHKIPARCRRRVTEVLLFQSAPRCVHVHDAVHHLAAVARVGGHAGRVRVLVGVLSGSRWAPCGI